MFVDLRFTIYIASLLNNVSVILQYLTLKVLHEFWFTILFSSWGPEDDGRTVDGPHPLGKVSKKIAAVLIYHHQWAVQCYKWIVQIAHALLSHGCFCFVAFLNVCFLSLYRQLCNMEWLQGDMALAASLWWPVGTVGSTTTTATTTAMPTLSTLSRLVKGLVSQLCGRSLREQSELKSICVPGAVDEKGKKPFYAEDCASMLAVTFSSGGNKLRNIVRLSKTHSRTHTILFIFQNSSIGITKIGWMCVLICIQIPGTGVK